MTARWGFVMAREFVHVVSDASDTRTSLGLLLETEGFCVQFYETGKAFLDRLRSAKGRVLAVIRMPGLDGMELLRSLQTAAPTPLVVMLMLHSDVPLAVEAMKLGVSDVIVEPFDNEMLLKALRSAVKQDEADAAAALDVQNFLQRVARLTLRERQVFDHLIVGHTNKETGRHLEISPRTVEIHRAKVMAKMGPITLQGLVHNAVRAGLFDPLRAILSDIRGHNLALSACGIKEENPKDITLGALSMPRLK